MRLVGNDLDAGVEQLAQPRQVEVGRPDMGDLAGPLEVLEDQAGLDEARRRRVPPVELDQIQPLHPQPAARSVDDALHIGAIDGGQPVVVGDEFRVDLIAAGEGWMGGAEIADERLDAGWRSTGPWPPARCQPPFRRREIV